MVEFAIILPLLLLLIFGMIEFGCIFYDMQVLTNAAREGARYGIVSKNPRYNEGAITTHVNNYCANRLVSLKATSAPKTTVACIKADGTIGNACTAMSQWPDNPEYLKVEVTYIYGFLVFPKLDSLLGGSFDGTLTLTKSATMTCE